MLEYRPPKHLLTGQTILVTGAGEGIGRALAQGFAEHGATVVLVGPGLDALESVYDEIESAGGPQPAIYPITFEGATDHDYQQLAETLQLEFGHLDGLIHNAAILRLLSRIDDYDVATWYKVLQVNLNAPFMLTQACLPLLRKSPEASIIFVSDRVGRKGKAYWGAYGVSKFGLEGLMQILAEELENETRIRVNSVDPGPCRTNLRAHAYPGEDPQTVKPPDRVLPLFLWLLGPEGRGTHGQALSVDPE
jgi:NAD(P)-dependent dehydrogenase (short-subunit alcohol dehydrogenase family)